MNCNHTTTTTERLSCPCHVTCDCRLPDAGCHGLPSTWRSTTLPHPASLQARGEEPEQVNHPAHYGGADNPYEAIKVIDAWGLGFNLGTVLKYIARHEHKGTALVDLEKAAWYLAHEIETRKRGGG